MERPAAPPRDASVSSSTTAFSSSAAALSASRARLSSLCAASSRLAAARRTQAEREREIQAVCNSVWTVTPQQYSVSGKCGERQQFTVSHTYTQPVATIDGGKYAALRQAMAAHLEYTRSALASAHFDHALRQLHLVLAVQAELFAGSRRIEAEEAYGLLQAVVGRLASAEEPCDEHTRPFLRHLALLLGAEFIAAAGAAGADAARTARLLHLLYTGRGCGWAAPLLQPAVGEVVSTRWVWHALVNGPALHGALPAEGDLAAFLSQVDWRRLAALAPADVSAFVVQPIQRALRRLCESEQLASLLLVGKILTAAVQAHPSLAVAALTAITRSTVRTALRCAPLLVLWQWHLSPPETLWTAWCEIYRVSATRLDDFAQRHPLQQQAQQKEFVTFQLSEAAAASSVYASEPLLAAVNDKLHFPMLACLRRLALHAAFPRDGAVPPEPRLARLCARELLAIAVMDVPHEGGPVLQLEAAASLSTLCQQIPELISAVVEEVVLQLPHLTASTRGYDRVRSLLDALSFDGWRVELPQLDSLCSLLTASSLSFTHHSPSTPHAGLSSNAAALLSTATAAPALPPPHGAITRRQLEIALAPPSAPPAEHEAPLAALRAKVGCALFERVDWRRVGAACRERGLLLLAACRARVPPSWWWGQLLGAAGAALVATELSPHVFDGLMHAVPADAEPIPGALAAMQSMLVVAAAQGAIAAGGRASLLEMGMQHSLWQRLGQLIEVAQHTALRHLVEKVLAVLVVAPADVPSPLPPLLSSYMAVAPSHAEAMRMMMLNSLAQADAQSHDRWITLWASLLAPLVATDAAAASLLDTLIHCVFAAADMTIADSPITAALLNCQLAKRQVLGFLSGRKVWLALAAALAYMPQLPSDAPIEDALRISSTQPLDARVRSIHSSMLSSSSRRHGSLGEEMKTGFLTTHEGRRAGSPSLSDAAAWGVGGPSPTAALSGEATEYTSMSGGGREGTHASREALSHCALGILFEAAVSLERDVRALLFWERFFVLYFSAYKLEPGFFPPARQAEANDHFGRMARSFEPTDRRVYMLYECFTTWSEEIIPKRGAFFTPDAVSSEGNEHFISIVTAAYPPPYFRSRPSSAASIDGNEELDASGLGQELALTSLQPLQIKMRPSAEQAVPADVCSDPRATRADLATPPDAPPEARSKEVLHQMLPTPAPLPSTDAIASELRREERALQERLAKARAVLADRIKRQAASGTADSAPPDDDDCVALWDELSEASNEYRNSILSVRRVDAEYLSLIRQLNVNQSSGESKQVLVRHPECEQPVMFVVPQIKVVPGPAYVRERLQANREEFLSFHRSMQRLTHTFAAYAALLELVARDIQLDFSFQQAVKQTLARENGSSGHPPSESVASGREQSLEMPAGAIELFFMLLPVPLGYALPPTISRLCEALTGLVAEIGYRYVKGNPDLQMRLLKAIVKARCSAPPVLMPAAQLQQLRVHAAVGGQDGSQDGVVVASSRDDVNAHVDTSGGLRVPLINRSEEAAALAESEPARAQESGHASKTRISVRLPDSVVPNHSCSAKLPSGKQIMFKAPSNATPGMMVQVDVNKEDMISKQQPLEPPQFPEELLDVSSEADLLNRHSLSWLSPIVTPNVLLDKGRAAEFVQLLNVLAEARTDRLDANDIEILCGCFDVQRYLARLPLAGGEPTSTMATVVEEEEVTVLALTVEQLLGTPAFHGLGVSFIERISHTSFPHNLSFALNIVLSSASSGGLIAEWHTCFATLPMDQLQLKEAGRLLHILNERLPLPAKYMDSAVTFAHWVLLSSPHVPAELAKEIGADGSATPSDGASSVWSEVLGFFQASLSDASLMSEKTFANLLDLLCQVVHNSPCLVDRMWHFFSEMIAPAAAAIGSATAEDTVKTKMAELPWHQVNCHLVDDGFVPGLLSALSRFRETVHVIFSKIDWICFLTNLVSRAREHAHDGVPRREPQFSALLRIICDINLVSPQSISNGTRIAIYGDGPSVGEVEPQLKLLHANLMSLAEPFSLSELFNGTALLSPLASGCLTEDPSEKLVENAALLYAVCAHTAHPEALAAAVEEARSLLFFSCSDSGGNLFWHLPFSSHIAILSGILVPGALAVCRTVPLPHEEMATVLRALLSSADTAVPGPHVFEAGFGFPVTDVQPFPPFPPTGATLEALERSRELESSSASAGSSMGDGVRASRRWFGGRTNQIHISDVHGAEPAPKEVPASLSPEEIKFNDLAMKMASLVGQFCRGASMEVALVTIGLLPTTVRSTAVLARLMEAALQAYLNNASLHLADGMREVNFSSEPLSVMGAAMASQPDLSLADAVLQCISQQTPMTLRLLLELQLSTLETESPMVWMPTAIECVKHAMICRVPPAREFELLPLWFYVIEIIAFDGWLSDYSVSIEALQAFSKSIQSACGLTTTSSLWETFGREPVSSLQTPAMQLAGRALLLYFNHAAVAKQRGQLRRPVAVNFADSTPELKAQMAALLKCQHQVDFQSGFDGFFVFIAQLSDSRTNVTLAQFKRQVVSTLLPVAPYLQGF